MKYCAALLVLLIHTPAWATWSIVAADLETGEVAIASATCLPQAAFRNMSAKGLMDVQAIVVPGVGAAVAQAEVDETRENQRFIFDELSKGSSPRHILAKLRDKEGFEARQFAIVDLKGRHSASTVASHWSRSAMTYAGSRRIGLRVALSCGEVRPKYGIADFM